MSCKEFEVAIKPGDDIKWAGFIEILDVTDFTGYTLIAEFRAKNMNSNLPGTLLGTGTVAWISLTAGTFYLLVSRADTIDWPLGITIMLDISVMDPDGIRVRTETGEFTTVSGVTEVM